MKTAAIYCRVSSDGQEENTSLDTQHEACLKRSEELPCNVQYTFREVYSGLTLNRPELEELRELIRNRQIDTIIAYTLDRVSRDPVHFIILQDEMEKAGVELVLCTETLDSTDIGKLISYIKGYAAKLEVEKIKERFSRGKSARLKEGKIPQGNGVGIFGFNWNRELKMRELNLFEAETVREMFNRLAAGEALVSIGRDLNNRGVPTKAMVISNPEERKLWYSLTIRRIIHNQAYMRKTYFGMTSRISRAKTIQHPQEKWISLPDASPPIVSEKLFHQANSQLAKPKARTGRPKNEYLLRHHVFCAVCGRPLVGHCLNKKYRYYQCSAARPMENAEQTCRARLLRAGDLEETVWEKVKEVLRDPQIVIAEITKQRMEADGSTDKASLEDDIQALEKRLKEYEKRRVNLLEAMELGEFDKDEILDRLNNLKLLRSEAETRLRQLEDMKVNIANLENAQIKLDEVYSTVLENIENCSDDVKKVALDALDIKVHASTDKVEIHGVLPLALPTTEQTSA